MSFPQKNKSMLCPEKSWHDIGVYDVPAAIDYILELTNKKRLSYAGVSQGGAVLLGSFI